MRHKPIQDFVQPVKYWWVAKGPKSYSVINIMFCKHSLFQRYTIFIFCFCVFSKSYLVITTTQPIPPHLPVNEHDHNLASLSLQQHN